MNIEHKGYMKACGNRGVNENSIFYHIMHDSPRRPWRLSLPCLNGSLPSHSFVMPIQGVEASFANGMGQCPCV